MRRGLVNFASYNYLGLSYRQEVKDAIKAAVDIYGGGSSGSPILSGTTVLHQQLADEVASINRSLQPHQEFITGWLNVLPDTVLAGKEVPPCQPR